MIEKYANALEDLNKANELQPNNAVTLRICGKVRLLMDKFANALEDFNKANEFEPNDALILKIWGEV